MTQEEIIEFVKSADKVKDRYCEMRAMNGYSFYVWRLEKDGKDYEVWQEYAPFEYPEVAWHEPRLLKGELLLDI